MLDKTKTCSLKVLLYENYYCRNLCRTQRNLLLYISVHGLDQISGTCSITVTSKGQTESYKYAGSWELASLYFNFWLSDRQNLPQYEYGIIHIVYYLLFIHLSFHLYFQKILFHQSHSCCHPHPNSVSLVTDFICKCSLGLVYSACLTWLPFFLSFLLTLAQLSLSYSSSENRVAVTDFLILESPEIQFPVHTKL